MLSDENMEETDFSNGRIKTTCTVVQTESHSQKGNLHTPDLLPEKCGRCV